MRLQALTPPQPPACTLPLGEVICWVLKFQLTGFQKAFCFIKSFN